MKITTWNVNSIKARLGHVVDWLKANQPDLLLLQELKGLEFPAAAFHEIGYESVAVGQKAYNGVAILSKKPVEVVAKALPGDEADAQARYIEVMADGWRVVNIYLPNGNPIGTEKFAYKLAWMDRLIKQMAAWRKSGERVVIAGDYNVIPEEIDCHDPAAWAGDALFQPESRARFRKMLHSGFRDAFRALHPNTQAFTFWDYFANSFERNNGIRIDHFLLSPKAADRLEACEIDAGPRGLEKPSDHVPVTVTLR